MLGDTRHRESLQTKNEAEARRLIAAKNQAASQPVFNLEMAKVYLRAHDPLLCERTRTTVSDAVQQTYKGPTSPLEKFIKSEPMALVFGKKLIHTTSRISWLLNHPEAGIFTNVFLRILHNRASTACLLPTYTAAVGPPTLPYEDEMLTMLLARFSLNRALWRLAFKTPAELVFIGAYWRFAPRNEWRP